MSEQVKEAEVVVETALVPVDNMTALLKDSDKPVFKAMENLGTLNWRDLKPNQTALLLMQRPMAVSGGGSMYLSFKQALYFAVRAYELGVSPFSSGIWFDPNRFAVNLTLEGKKEVARNKGIDLGPPKFEMLTREWKDVPKVTEAGEEAKKAGFTKDVGYKCSIRVGDVKNQEYVDYTAWMNEWYVGRSPLWKQKAEHMLQIRAHDKAISMAMGTGISSFPDEKELG